MYYLLPVSLTVSNAHVKAKLLSFLPELDWTCIIAQSTTLAKFRGCSSLLYTEVVCLLCVHSQVHRTVYDRIEVEGAYDSLRSTRHFGGLVWYLVQQERIVGLVKDLVEKHLWVCCYASEVANLRACKLVSRERLVLLVSVFCHTINCSSLSPRWSEGEALVELYLLCHPHCSLASSTDSTPGKKLEVGIVISSLH